MKKNNLLLVAVFVSGAVLGAFLLSVWMGRSSQELAVPAAAPEQLAAAPLLSTDELKVAALPQDTLPADPAPEVKRAVDLPSQLVRSELPEGVVAPVPAATSAPAEPGQAGGKPGVVLSDGQNTVVLGAQRPAQRAADGSAITLIEAPVAYRRIQNLSDYKAFKRTARGSYPAADFTREEVIVLESASNLPDNMFEIVDILPGEETVKILYRVNVFGLAEKVNTHSAKKIVKSQKPLVLEQVL